MTIPTSPATSASPRQLIRFGLLCALTCSLAFQYAPSLAAPSAVALKQSDTRAVTVHMRLADFQVSPTEYDAETYDQVRFSESLFVADPGAPDLPVLRRLVAIPKCLDVRVDYRIISDRWLDKIRIVPARTFDERISQSSRELQDKLYRGKTQYPGEIAHLLTVGRIRGQNVALLEIQPLQFIASDHRLRVIEEIEVTLTFLGASGPLRHEAGPMQSQLEATLINGSGRVLAAPALQKGLGSVTWVTGTTPAEVAISVSACEADYLIIAASDLPTTPISQLAWKRADFNGLNVAIATMDQIDDEPNTEVTPLELKSLIQAVYDDASAGHMADGRLGYVMLLGDAWDANHDCLIPSYYGYSSVHGSDAFYSFLDGEDELADIFLGRIPVNIDPITNESPQLENVVNKILAYGRESGDPLSNLMFTGDLSGISSPDFAELQALVIPDHVVTTEMHRGPLNEGSDIGFSVELATAIESIEPWILAGYGHGNPMYFAHTFFAPQYDHLTNTKFPLFLLSGCGLGRFDITDQSDFACLQEADVDSCDVIAEGMLIQDAGAIGTIAFSWSSVSPSSALAAFNGFYESIFQHYAFSQGEILNTIKWTSSNDQVRRHLTLFGDPALNIMWEEASMFDVDLCIHPTSIEFTDREVPYFSNGESTVIQAVVENLGDDDAIRVVVEYWDGDPLDPSSTLLGISNVSRLPGYGGSSTVSLATSLSGVGHHEIFLRTYAWRMDDLTEENNQASIHCGVFDYVDGFPVETSGVSHSEVVIADLDPDRAGLEMLLMRGSALVCFGADGTELWQHDYGIYWNLLCNPVVGEVYKNDTACCVILDGLDLKVLDGSTGAVLQSFTLVDQSLTQHRKTMLVTDVITDDESLEVVILLKQPSGELAAELYTLYEHEGTNLRWKLPVNETMASGELGSGDMDGDGDQELVALVRDNSDTEDVISQITIIQASSDLAGPPPTSTVVILESDSSSLGSIALIPAAAGGGGLDLLVPGGQSGQQISRIAADGSIIYSNGPLLGDAFLFTVEDLEDDGDLEIVVAAADRLWIFDAESGGAVQNVSVEIPGIFQRKPLTADLDGDGDLEIVALYDLGDSHYLQTYNSDGSLFRQPDVLFGESSPRFALVDPDEDGIIDAIVSSKSHVLVYTLGSDPGRLGWAQAYMDPAAGNRFEQPIAGTYSRDVYLTGRVRAVADVDWQGDVHIGPGTDLLVGDSGMITASQTLQMWGATNRPIQIRPEGDPTQPGSWSGLVLATDCLTNLRHTVIQGAVTGILADDFDDASSLTAVTVCYSSENGAVLSDVGAVTITDCVFRDNGYAGLRCNGSSPHIVDSRFESNLAGINCQDSSHPVIEFSLVYDNTDGIALGGDSFPDADNNIICGNSHLHVANLNPDQVHAAYFWYNYWDYPSGPKPGKFMGNVVYEPFLTVPPFDPGFTGGLTKDSMTRRLQTDKFHLGAAVPNPFNPMTCIKFDVTGNGAHVDLTIFDIRGRQVTTLVSEFRGPGSHEATWTGIDHSGRQVSTGVYFVRLKAEQTVQTMKILLTK